MILSIEEVPTRQMMSEVAALRTRLVSHGEGKMMQAQNKTATPVPSDFEGDRNRGRDSDSEETEDQAVYYPDGFPRFSNRSQSQGSPNTVSKKTCEPVNVRSEIPAPGTVSTLRQIYEPNQDRRGQETSVKKLNVWLQISQSQRKIAQARKQSVMGMLGRLAQSQSTSRLSKSVQQEHIIQHPAPLKRKRSQQEQVPDDQDELTIVTTKDGKSKGGKDENSKRQRIMISDTPEGARDDY